MKKCFAVVWTMLLVGILGLCAGCKDSPKNVVEKWQAAILKGDAEAAKEYVTGKKMEGYTGLIAASCKADKNSKKATELKDAKVSDEKIDGETATVTLGEGSLKLQKVDGKWKISDMGKKK